MSYFKVGCKHVAAAQIAHQISVDGDVAADERYGRELALCPDAVKVRLLGGVRVYSVKALVVVAGHPLRYKVVLDQGPLKTTNCSCMAWDAHQSCVHVVALKVQ